MAGRRALPGVGPASWGWGTRWGATLVRRPRELGAAAMGASATRSVGLVERMKGRCAGLSQLSALQMGAATGSKVKVPWGEEPMLLDTAAALAGSPGKGPHVRCCWGWTLCWVLTHQLQAHSAPGCPAGCRPPAPNRRAPKRCACAQRDHPPPQTPHPQTPKVHNAAGALLRERSALAGAAGHVDDALAQAQSVTRSLLEQRRAFDGVGDKLAAVGERFPAIGGLLGAIQRRKDRVGALFGRWGWGAGARWGRAWGGEGGRAGSARAAAPFSGAAPLLPRGEATDPAWRGGAGASPQSPHPNLPRPPPPSGPQDTLVIAAVVAGCTFLIILYVFAF